MSDTQKSLNMSANINATAMQLRDDLGKIKSPALASKPHDMVTGVTVADNDGYLEILEGMNACYSVISTSTVSYTGIVPPSSDLAGSESRNHVSGEHFPMWWVAQNPDTGSSDLPDLTVGDVDDILAFTAEADAGYAFRGLINNNMSESLHAEIIWFVRGTTLYRRVLLLDDYNTDPNRATNDQNQQSFYTRNDLSVRLDGTTIKANTMQDLSRRENRFAHPYTGITFPFSLYNGNEAWYFLRMPTLEETVHDSLPFWTPAQSLPILVGSLTDLRMNGKAIITSPNPPSPPYNPPTTPYWDFGNNLNWDFVNSLNGLSNSTNGWNLDSKSGSLSTYVSATRHPRAGEDIVLKNVISFDIKVWNPYWVPCATARQTTPNNTASSSNLWLWAPPQYVDLGQDRFILKNANGVDQECFVNYYQDLASFPAGIPTGSNDRGIGFCSKGRYSGISTTKNFGNCLLARTIDYSSVPPQVTDNDYWRGTILPCVFDSWTTAYENETTTHRTGTAAPTIQNYSLPSRTGIGLDTTVANNNGDDWECPPPYTEDLDSIQVTIRCFEPQSGHIKQVRVVQKF
jgi:hypothetical protein